MKRFKRFIALFMALATLLSAFPAMTVFAAEKSLSLSQAISLTLKNSSKINKVKLTRIKKQISLKQAYSAIADTRRNESTIRFSLLFNIKFPEKHGMPKEIELLTKIPDLQSELRILNAELEYTKLSETAACEQQYYDVLEKQYEIAYCEDVLAQAKAALSKINDDYAKGNAKKSDITYLTKKVQEGESALKSANTAFEKSKEKLSAIVGVNVSSGYKFSAELPELELDRTMLKSIKTFAAKNEFSYYKAAETKNAKQTDTNTIKGVYSGRYGNYVSDVMSYINSCNARGELIDYDVFIVKYNNFLTAIESPWVGNYVIKLLFFKINIPKIWFKRTYSGDRYLEDERYALFVSLTELDEAEQDRKTAYNDLMTALSDGYDNLVTTAATISSAKDFLTTANAEYQEALLENRAGALSYTELYDKKTALLEQEKTIEETRYDYAKSLSSYNLQSAGFISQYLKNSSNITDNNYEDGVSSGEDANGADSSQPSWYIVPSNASYKYTFGVKIPDSYGVDSYALYTAEGKIIGKKTKIGTDINSLSTVYSDTTLLTVRLYDGDTLKYTAVFDGMQYNGNLTLQTASAAAEFVAGTWSLYKNGLKATFTVKSDEFVFDSFELFSDGKSIGTGTAENGLMHLSMTFADISDFTVKLYSSGEEIANTTVITTDDGENRLMLKQ